LQRVGQAAVTEEIHVVPSMSSARSSASPSRKLPQAQSPLRERTEGRSEGTRQYFAALLCDAVVRQALGAAGTGRQSPLSERKEEQVEPRTWHLCARARACLLACVRGCTCVRAPVRVWAPAQTCRRSAPRAARASPRRNTPSATRRGRTPPAPPRGTTQTARRGARGRTWPPACAHGARARARVRACVRVYVCA
jgi:hypothetical protein